MNFRELGLSAPILRALTQAGYTEPTPIQQQAIPPALAGRDVLGCAQTGTGKTCAFATPILQRLDGKLPKPRVIRALVLTPTRELAIQIQDSITAYGQDLPLRSAVIFGGVGQQPQVDAIRRGLDILVATPGRLLDLQGQGLLDLSHIEIFVLDEADRMLDMGFIHDVRRVLKLLPTKKQTLLFSATMPPEVMGLVNGLLHNYVKVAVDPVSSPVEAIQQTLYYVDKANKTKLLAHLMDELHIPSALVFSRTKHGANRIAQDLSKRGISAAAIHGNKSQTARVQALGDFKAGKIRVLVATDIAARGIDIEDLGCVFNYNLPDVPETYVHRIGRTGRAGKGGVAIAFCQFDEKDELKGIEKLLGRPIPVVEGHPFPMENFDPPKKDKHGKPINAEDAEARAAAKELRRSQANARALAGGPVDLKSSGEVNSPCGNASHSTAGPRRPRSAGANGALPETPPVENAPTKNKRRKKKKSGQGAEVTPVLTPKAAETTPGRISGKKENAPSSSVAAMSPLKTEAVRRPAVKEEPDDEPYLPRLRLDRPLSAGVRQGRLEDTLPAEPSMPAADFYKPNPLDSDVIMDATARLLAPRRPVSVSRPQPQREPEKKAEKPQKAKPAPKQENKTQRPDQPQGKVQAKKPKQGKKQALKQEQKQEPKQEPKQAESVLPASLSGKKKRRRQRGPRQVEAPLRSDRQKDSTQQKSLMRPYYISHDDE